MKPTTNSPTPAIISTTASSPSTPSTPTRRVHPHQSSSKELDAKDLENQEISLCIPSSSSTLGQRYSSPLFSRDSPPPYLFITPTTSPSQNGGSTASRSSNRTERFFRSGHPSTPPSQPPPSSTITSSSFVTPPVTPPRQLPPSPLLSVEELVLNMHMNWSPPALARKAVQYHEINDDDEIEISITPSSGSQIRVTKHSVRGNGNSSTPVQAQGPVCVNGENREYLAESRIQRRVTKHVMVENLEHELQMTCSSSSVNGGDDTGVQVNSNDGVVAGRRSGGDEEVLAESSREPDRVGGRLRSEFTERRLKRLHSQLQLGQQSNIARLTSVSASTTSTNSSSPNSGAGEGNGCKRMRIHSTNQASSFNGNQNGGGGGEGGGKNRVADNKHPSTNSSSSTATATATVTTSNKISPRVSTRINTRASPRRPKTNN